MGPRVSSIYGGVSRCARLQHFLVVRFVVLPISNDAMCSHFDAFSVIRQMLIHKNKQLTAYEAAMKGVTMDKVVEATDLEGMTLKQAMERRKGYRS